MAIDLTSYEKQSLYRFLGLYLGSILILLIIIGVIFYQHSKSVLINKIKFEMLYKTRIIETRLIRIEKLANGEVKITKNIIHNTEPVDYKVGIFDKYLKPIYSEIDKDFDVSKKFYSTGDYCFSIVKSSDKNHKFGYIVLKNEAIAKHLKALKIKIFSYLLAAFLFMAAIGIWLSRLFLKPIRQKIEDLDRFIEDTTHELNTPVSAILMTLQTLKGVDEKKLNRLKASAIRLSSMYDTLSANLNKEAKEAILEEFDLKELIQKRVEYLKILAESKKITFYLQLESTPIKASREDIKRVLDNLITNAIKYNDNGGTITIKLKDSILQICDSGIGISPEKKEDIFKRYKRANKERGGFGIGLSIVSALCKEYAIDINIKDNKPKGTCFILNFHSCSVTK